MSLTMTSNFSMKLDMNCVPLTLTIPKYLNMWLKSVSAIAKAKGSFCSGMRLRDFENQSVMTFITVFPWEID